MNDTKCILKRISASALRIYKDMQILQYVSRLKCIHGCTIYIESRCKCLQLNPNLNEMFEEWIRPSGALPISSGFVRIMKEKKTKMN